MVVPGRRSGLVEAGLVEALLHLVGRFVLAADRGTGRGRLPAAQEEPVEDEDAARDVEFALVVRVRGIRAGDLALAEEEHVQDAHAVRDVDLAVAVRVAAAEPRPALRDRLAAVEPSHGAVLALAADAVRAAAAGRLERAQGPRDVADLDQVPEGAPVPDLDGVAGAGRVRPVLPGQDHERALACAGHALDAVPALGGRALERAAVARPDDRGPVGAHAHALDAVGAGRAVGEIDGGLRPGNGRDGASIPRDDHPVAAAVVDVGPRDHGAAGRIVPLAPDILDAVRHVRAVDGDFAADLPGRDGARDAAHAVRERLLHAG